MKKSSLLISLLFICFIGSLSAQEKTDEYMRQKTAPNAFYGMGYGGALTVGYQRLITDWFGINVSAASLAQLHKDLRDGFSFPLFLSFYPVGNEHRLFIDFGVNIITKGKSNFMYDFHDGLNIPIMIAGGYNYYPFDGGKFAKVGGGFIIYNPNESDAPAAFGGIISLSFGVSF